MTEVIFNDRKEAGERLGEYLSEFDWENPMVFGIPRGGVIIAKEVAERLSAPFDLVITRKLGVPFNRELGFGAIAPEGIIIIDYDLVEKLGISEFEIRKVEQQELAEMDRRLKQYRGKTEYRQISGRTALIVDDGIATGVTMEAAIAFIKKLNPGRIIVASPTCATDAITRIRKKVDDVVCISEPELFMAVGEFYKYFPQVTDEEVTEITR